MLQYSKLCSEVNEMKRYVTALSVAALLVLLAACGDGRSADTPAPASNEIITESGSPAAPAEEPSDSSDSSGTDETAEPATPVFSSDSSEYRGGISECIVRYYNPVGMMYAEEDIIYSSPGEVFSDSFTDHDGNPCPPPELGLTVPELVESEDCEITEKGNEKNAVWKNEKGMILSTCRYDEAGNSLKWMYYDDSGNIDGWVTYTYRFADGSENTGEDM